MAQLVVAGTAVAFLVGLVATFLPDTDIALRAFTVAFVGFFACLLWAAEELGGDAGPGRPPGRRRVRDEDPDDRPA